MFSSSAIKPPYKLFFRVKFYSVDPSSVHEEITRFVCNTASSLLSIRHFFLHNISSSFFVTFNYCININIFTKRVPKANLETFLNLVFTIASTKLMWHKNKKTKVSRKQSISQLKNIGQKLFNSSFSSDSVSILDFKKLIKIILKYLQSFPHSQRTFKLIPLSIIIHYI